MNRILLAMVMMCGVFGAAHQACSQPNPVLYSENFDSLTLGPSVNERLGEIVVTRLADDPDSTPIPNAFTKTGPAGWSIDNNLGMYQGTPTTGNAGVPGQGVFEYGVDEWEGWSFANKEFWISADDQDRSQFANGMGTVAVADGDEYFDNNSPTNEPTHGGFYNSSLKTPSIPVSTGNIYTLSFDSTWRDEAFDNGHPDPAFNNLNNQSVEVLAIYDDGTVQTRAAWNSDSTSGAYKADATNETLSYNFGVPSAATSVRFEFNYANAADDWWWAIDNLDVSLAGGGASVWSEDFEGLTLGDSVNERRAFGKSTAVQTEPGTMPRDDSFTNTPPAEWNIDNSGMPAGTLGNNDIGVYEWEGWNFAPLSFWTFADGQGRADFTKCEGNCAIADGDEWDDLNDPADQGLMNSLLESPMIDISSVKAGELAIQFDSSWRDEDDQVAVLTVDYGDGNGPLEILHWESHQEIDDGAGGMIPNPFFKDDSTNETVTLRLDNPAGATTAQFRFGYVGGDDWWWAIDNVQVGVIPEPSSLILITLVFVSLGAFGGRRR